MEDQASANERLPILAETPAAVRWVSAEPLLAPVDLGEWVFNRRQVIRDCMNGPVAMSWDQADAAALHPLEWVVVGGESGPGARPMDPEWARALRDECEIARVPFYMKQMARKQPIPPHLMHREYPKGHMA